MDFYKLSDFQLYSIINSRHLDKENREQAERELERRNLSEEEIEKLAKELAERNKTSSFSIPPNVIWLILALLLLILLRQYVFTGR